MEGKIEWAVIRLRNYRSGRPSGIRVEHMKSWLEEARKVEKDETTTAGAEATENMGTTAFQPATEPMEAANWEILVELAQTAFWDGKLSEEAT